MAVLLVLALIWAVALTPMIRRKLSERNATFSVAHFHRQIGVLRRTRTGRLAGATIFVPTVPQKVADRSSAARQGPRRVCSRRQTERRRRVLTTLFAFLAGTFLLGWIPAMRGLWDLSLITLGATVAYLALLIQATRTAIERHDKVVPFPVTQHEVAQEAERPYVIIRPEPAPALAARVGR